MTQLTPFLRLVVYCPPEYEDTIKQAFWTAGAGKWGNYECYSFTSDGISTWKPRTGAHPALGRKGELSSVKEKRIETICPQELLPTIVAAIKKIHPYETPALEVYHVNLL